MWPAAGDAATGVKLEREAAGVWTVVAPNLPLTASEFVDRTAVTGTAYRYRCTWFNASGDGPARDPSQQITLVGTPGKGAIQVIIVTE